MFLILRPLPKLPASVEKFTQAGLDTTGAALIDIEILGPEATLSIHEFVTKTAAQPINSAIIVTSTVAANELIALSQAQKIALLGQRHIIAVGPSTFSILQKAFTQYPNNIDMVEGNTELQCIMAKPANSEGVIAAIKSLSSSISSVLLCKGEGGRGLIEVALKELEINVFSANLYRRVALAHPVFSSNFAQDQIHCIIATSAEIVDAAYLHFDAQWLNLCRWIVVSKRIEQHLLARGASFITVSDGATDKQLIAAASQVKGFKNV